MLFSGIVLLSCVQAVLSSSPAAAVYTFDSTPSTASTESPPTLSPEAVRLWLSQRLDVSQYYRAAELDERSRSLMSELGDDRALLQDIEIVDDGRARVVLLIEGVNRVEDIIPEAHKQPTFFITYPPSSNANGQLVRDLSHRISHVPSEQRRLTSVQHVTDLEHAIQQHGVGSEAYRDAVVTVSDMVRKRSLPDASREVTLILFPPSTPQTKAAQGSYGSSPLVRRTAVPRRSTEKPLEDEPVPSGLSAQSSESSSNSTNSPIKSTIPVCYTSFDTCMTTTKRCSGHGRCMKKFTVEDASKDPDKAKHCFACMCMRTVLHEAGNGKGGKSIFWGGAACQKKDVSSSFFLIAGGSIFFLGAVTWAIGLLYSIGEERLPGVLGAGVSGPKATR